MEKPNLHMYKQLLTINLPENITNYPYNIKDSIEFTKNELNLRYIENYHKKDLSDTVKGGIKQSKVILYLY